MFWLINEVKDKTISSWWSHKVWWKENCFNQILLPLYMFNVDSDTAQTEAKLQVGAELVSLSKSVVSQTFTELGEVLKVLV